MLLEAIVWGLFGCIIGSFLNVVVLRRGTGRGILGRSSCFSCGNQLHWYELIPVISWVALRGKCRHCKSRISLQYPLVEAITGLGFALVGAAPLTVTFTMLGALIVAILIAIAAYDFLHTIIPDAWVYTFAGLSFIWLFLSGEGTPSIWAIVAGPIAALPLFALFALSRGAWMGFGDVKLALGIGWILGIYNGLVAILLAFVIGAAIGVCILLPLPYLVSLGKSLGITALSGLTRGFTMKSEVPFGPFLILGFSIIWFMTLNDVDLRVLERLLSLS